MDLLQFVKQLPKNWVAAPIYAKGVDMRPSKRNPQPGKACGKSPLGEAGPSRWAPARAALEIEKYPDTFKAIGVFTGAQSNGLVIFDVDYNLGAIQQKWSADLENAPRITSPKKNAAKFLFRVPKEHWGHVSGIGLKTSKEGWEVLWGMQGLLYGAYPGSRDGKHPEGQYTFEGDVNAVPEAPEWLIARMREAFDAKNAPKDAKRIPDKYSLRSREEKIVIAEACLSVIPPLGRGSENFWWKIGAILYSELPNEDGLRLWMEWSLKDEDYADEWETGKNPCEERWNQGFRGSGLSFGTLVFTADQHDPERTRFQKYGCASLIEEIEATTQSVRVIRPNHEQIVERANAAMREKNPSLVQHLLHEIALDSGYRDATHIVKLLIADQEYKRGSHGGTLQEILTAEEEPIEYLIPELLPRPGTLLIHGRGGSGKTMAMLTLAKHVARGLPFNVRGMEVPVEQGTVLWLNGDQNSRRIRSQFEDLGFTPDDPVIVENKCSMLWYPWFINLMEQHKPKFVVWDSVTACMRGSAFDQNKAEYAEPLYWYSAENGESFPETTIAFIHHQGKQGTFRGTSALEDAVDESWGLRVPSKEEQQKFGHDRVINVGKSREGNTGKALLLQQKDDLTFQLKDMPEEAEENRSLAASVSEGVLACLRASDRWMSRVEIYAAPVAGTKDAKKKCLERWVKKGLVLQEGKGKNALYKALSARAGGYGKSVPKTLERNEDKGSDRDNTEKVSRFCPDSVPVVPVEAGASDKNGTPTQKTGQKRDKIGTLSRPDLSVDGGSDVLGHESERTFTREERDQINDISWKTWEDV